MSSPSPNSSKLSQEAQYYHGTSAAAASSSSSSAIPLQQPIATDVDFKKADRDLEASEDYGATDNLLPAYADIDGELTDQPPGFSVYRPSVRRVCRGEDDIETVSHDEHLNTDGEALFRWLKDENRLVPRPEVHIRGTHTERRTVQRDGKKSTETTTVVDFNLRLDVTYCLIDARKPGILRTVGAGEKTFRGGRMKRVDASGFDDGRSIRSWADQYCLDTSMLKEFTMNKIITGHDHEFLTTYLTQLVRSTNYRGDITISFPVKSSKTHIYPSNRISRMRQSTLWRNLFYITMLWVITWPLLWFFTKRYHVVVSEWKMSELDDHTGGRKTNISEQSWVAQWTPAIRRCVLEKRQGPVTEADLQAALDAERVGSGGKRGAPVGGVAGMVRGVYESFAWGEDTW